MAVLTRDVAIKRATILEWPQIEALRHAYFTPRGQAVQRNERESAAWWIACVGERVAGCFSVIDRPDYGQRWILDFYRVAGKDGTRAAGAMYRAIFDGADADGLEVMCTVDPANQAHLTAALGRGMVAVGVICRRPSRSI